jgi:hypothetical protein
MLAVKVQANIVSLFLFSYSDAGSIGAGILLGFLLIAQVHSGSWVQGFCEIKACHINMTSCYSVMP